MTRDQIEVLRIIQGRLEALSYITDNKDLMDFFNDTACMIIDLLEEVEKNAG